jgi:aldehyde dehydrogenase (NAD+)
MGGKNAIVVLDDANLELALRGALWSGFGTSGQRCTASSRLIVERGVLAQFQDELVRRTTALTVGPGADPKTDVGPVINRTQRDRIAGCVDIGRGEGARVLAGGRILDGGDLRNGSYYAPTVLGELAPAMRVAQEEIFGPVVGILAADSFDHALEIANGTSYGLSLSIYTRDVFKAHRAIDELESGIVYVNMPTTGAEIQFPFGGIKDTGNGHREAGWTAMDFYTEWKSVYINYRDTDELVRAQIDTHDS